MAHLSGSTCKRFAALAAISVMFVVPAAEAQDQNAAPDSGKFSQDFALQAQAANKPSCQIIIQQTGTLAANVGATKLSSTGYAGEPARADVTTTNGAYYVSVDNPNGFIQAPTGGNNDVVFATWMSGRGKTSFGDTPGQNRVKLKNGLTNMEIGLDVVKQTGAFPAGRYRAELTLRCE